MKLLVEDFFFLTDFFWGTFLGMNLWDLFVVEIIEGFLLLMIFVLSFDKYAVAFSRTLFLAKMHGEVCPYQEKSPM